MKIKSLCCCILASLTVLLCGCEGCKISYPFHYDESEIKSISIVYLIDKRYAPNYEYETLVEIEDINSFLTEFKKIKFFPITIGDPNSVCPDTNVILVEYNNGDIEIITYDAHDIVIDGVLYCYGTANCDKEEFENFINSYLTEN